jgi:hypothetical protein
MADVNGDNRILRNMFDWTKKIWTRALHEKESAEEQIKKISKLIDNLEYILSES